MDFARLELLKLLGEDPAIRTRVFEDYENIAAIEAADIIITYTCDVTPSLAAQEALKAWLERGGRWYALHGTNSVLRLLSDGPNAGSVGRAALGPAVHGSVGQPVHQPPAHRPYRVEVADPQHPLVAGVEPFETTDELYHLETHGDLHVLLDTSAPNRARALSRPMVRRAVIRCSTSGSWPGRSALPDAGPLSGHYDLQPMLTGGPAWIAAHGICRCFMTCFGGAGLAEGAAGLLTKTPEALTGVFAHAASCA
jgi:hypothetical protein